MAKRVTFTGQWPKLKASEVSRFEHTVVNRKLPEDYRKFLLNHNNAEPDRNYFDSDGESTSSYLEHFLGVETAPLTDSPRKYDIVSALLAYRSDLPRHAIPIASVDRDDLLVIFTHGEYLGEIWIKRISETFQAAGNKVKPETGLSLVADSFTAFLNQLRSTPD